MSAPTQRCVIPRHDGRRPWATDGLLCPEHSAEIRDLIADVSDLYAELPWTGLPLAAPGPRYTDTPVTKHPDPPVPVNLAALVLRDPATRSTTVPEVNRERNGPRLESNGPDAPDVAATLADWCHRVATERGTSVPTNGVEAMLTALRTHLSWIAAQPWVVEFDRQLRNCRRWLAMAVGAPDTMPPPYANCPYCGRLVWTDLDRDVIKRRRYGQDVTEAKGRTDRVSCDCGARWTGVHDLARLLKINRDARRERATPSEEVS
jgi:hypothetical protein